MLKHFALSIIILQISCVYALFEREKGLNDWKIENLGEIKDLKFIENSPLVYTLSTKGLLALFDTDKQQITWKKELPKDEDFNLRYLQRNLLAYSSKRGILLNSHGHIIYDMHFEKALSLGVPNDTHHTAELFEFGGHIYSCYAKDYKVIIYKDYENVALLEYADGKTNEIPSMKPLQLIFDKKSSQLQLLALQEPLGEKRLVKFLIDINRLTMEESDQIILKTSDIKPFTSTDRTLNHVVLVSKNTLQFLNLQTMKVVKEVPDYQSFQVSLTDENVFINNGKKEQKVINLESKEEFKVKLDNEKCNAQRQTDSESIENSNTQLFIGISCSDKFSIVKGSNQADSALSLIDVNTSKNGKLLKLYHKSQNDFIVQFQDLSLHYIANSQVRWSREESLSQIKQIELMDQKSIRIESDLEYVQNVKHTPRIDQIPVRIIQRYTENVKYLITQFYKIVKSGDPSQISLISDTLGDQFGFKKILVMLTEAGKLVALTSNNGQVLWKQYFGQDTPQKIFIRNMLEKELGGSGEQYKQVAVVQSNKISFLNPFTGVLDRSFDIQQNKDTNIDYILIQLQTSKAQFILQISQASLNNGGKLEAYPKGQLTPELLENESIYFTYINKNDNTIIGYKLLSDLSTFKLWQLNLGKSGEKLFKIKTQFQTASEIDHLHFMPTSFSGENIVYKYLDSNIFAIATVNQADDLIFYLINGVSGKVVYKFFEKKVKLDHPVDMVLSENNFIVTFQRQTPTGLSQQELSVTELYGQRIEDNTKKILVDYYKGDERLNTHTISSFNDEQPYVIQETYIVPMFLKAIVLTQTQHHITGKNLIGITHSNQLYSIDNALFSARRPHGDNMVLGMDDQVDKKEGVQLDLKSIEFPPYDAVIPYQATKFLTYDLQLIGLDNVKAFPTRLESTTQILAFGYDIFFMRVSPENNFDLLQEGFNYTLLFAFIGGLFVVLYLLKSYVKSQTNSQNYLTS